MPLGGIMMKGRGPRAWFSGRDDLDAEPLGLGAWA
jgi:hypothetical protein